MPSSAAPKPLRLDISPSTISTVGTFSSAAAFALFRTKDPYGHSLAYEFVGYEEPAVPVAPVEESSRSLLRFHSSARVGRARLSGLSRMKTFGTGQRVTVPRAAQWATGSDVPKRSA